MAGGAVSRRFTFSMAGHAPTHGQRLIDLFDHTNFLNHTMTCRAIHFSSDVSHVREVDVVGYFVDPHPWNRLLAIPISLHFIDFGLLGLGGSRNYLMTSHAGAYRRDPRSN